MTTVGIVCEYNPFHNGHAAQFARLRARLGQDAAVVCVMSGNFVQRGQPALYDKQLRARAAVLAGASLVLELPLTKALSSAEGFAAGGVEILDRLGCEWLSFGSESADLHALRRTAQALLAPGFDDCLRRHLESGCSYPAARARALAERTGQTITCLPNDILAIEYCKALLRRGSKMELLPVPRPGDYHDTGLNPEAPSATGVRLSVERGDGSWRQAVPPRLVPLYQAGTIHTLGAGERAVLSRLRAMSAQEFAALPFGSEGLWSKLMKSCRAGQSVAQILELTKSKRYTHTRLSRMVLCAYLGLTARDLDREIPYVRILAFDDLGREVLRRQTGDLPLIHAGQKPQDEEYYAMECRAADLYTLFAHGDCPCGTEQRGRVCYLPKDRLHADEPQDMVGDSKNFTIF